jgi:hypothetical protein
MAAMTRNANVARTTRPVGTARAIAAMAAIGGAGALPACGGIEGFGGAVPPLATVTIHAEGDFASVQSPGAPDPTLRVALVWAAQWLTEPLCILPPENAQVADVVAAGCRDPFGFVPDRVGTSAPLGPDGTATLELFDLPAADVMIGDVTARIAYASLVIYDDRDDNGTLTLGRPPRLPGGEDDRPEDPGIPARDLVYAASFVSMTEPDSRLAFREGAFNDRAAFYPRNGCGEPMPSFSIVSAGGFTAAAAIAAQLRGELPLEDPASCRERTTDEPVVLTYRPPSELQDVACNPRRTDSSVRYREPPIDSPLQAGRTSACAKIPDFGSGKTDGMIQLVIGGRGPGGCAGVTHYVLRGCRNDPTCALPEWDITATPPSWWPCPVQAQ